MMKACNFFCLFWSFLFSISIDAKEFISIEKIERQVHAYILKEFKNQAVVSNTDDVKINIRQIDKRLRLEQCDKPLTLSLQNPPIKRNSSVKVQCQSKSPWSIYVSSVISLMEDVITIKHSLPRDHILQASDLSSRKQDVYTLRAGYSTQAQGIIGQQLKRPLKAGTVIFHHQLKEPEIIKKGDAITLIAKRGALSVIAPGIALTAGKRGDQIQVENKRSSRVVYGKIINPSTVEVL